MEPNKVLKERRVQMGLSESEVSRGAAISRNEYCDIEQDSSETLEVAPIRALKNICRILKLDLLELVGEKCAFCALSVPYVDGFQQQRHFLIAKRRIELGLSRAELADRLGFNEKAVVEMEQKEDFLEGWSISLIRALSEQLRVPLQILLAYPCPNCKR